MEIKKKFFIVIGRSGSGKGTQVELLSEYLTNQGNEVKSFSTGQALRAFATYPSFTAQKVKEVIDGGGLCPEYVAIWNWVNLLINNISNNTTAILDGAPRRLEEAHILETAVDFYQYDDVYVIYLNVSHDWAMDRLLSRGREDDIRSGVEKRLEWFDREVLPIVEYYSKNTKYKFLDINGMQSIENVHNEIINKINNVS